MSTSPHTTPWLTFGARAGARAGALAQALTGIVLIGSGCSDDDPVVVRDLTPPAAPQAVYSVTGDRLVTLYWVRNTEPDLAGYRVYRGPAYEGPFTPLALTGVTSYVDANLTNGITSFYAVAAYDAAGNESELSVENVFDTPRPAGFNVALGPAGTEASGGGLSGFDFSGPTVRPAADPLTDAYFDVTGGTRLMIAPDLQTDVQDAGYADLDALDWAPDNGWSPTGTVELIVGHSYYVATRDNHYAKFRVTALSDTQVRIDWAYQTAVNNQELVRPPRVGGGIRPALGP